MILLLLLVDSLLLLLLLLKLSIQNYEVPRSMVNRSAFPADADASLPLLLIDATMTIAEQSDQSLSVSLLLFRCCSCCSQRLLIELLSSIADANAPAVAADHSTADCSTAVVAALSIRNYAERASDRQCC